MTDLSTMLFGNGAGSIKDIDAVIKACKGPMSRIMVGSITAQRRTGNIGDTYYFHPQERWSINSLGLPNIGMDEYKKTLPYMAQKAHEYGKQLWASVSGFTPQEYAQMTAACFKAGVDGVEINLSCPNVWGGSERKIIPALDWNLTYEIVAAIRAELGELWDDRRKRIALKLSPTDDYDLIKRLVTTAVGTRIGSLTIGNTLPDQERSREDGKPALAFRSDESDKVLKHKGGLAGSGVKHANFAMIRKMRTLVPPYIRLDAAGGIFDDEDAFEALQAGATGFMCTTGYLEFGNRLFEPILSKLAISLVEIA